MSHQTVPGTKIRNRDVLLTYIGLLAMGKPAYESVHEFDDDPDFYKYALGIARSIPSEETLRQRMDKTVMEAKGEIEAFCQNKINSIAQAALVEYKDNILRLENL